MGKALKKGIDTLMLLSTKKSLGVTELAEALSVDKSTAFRILDTFLDAGMVEKSTETSKYRLGPAVLQLSRQYYKNFNIVETARPIMESLSSKVRESVHLCVLSNYSVVVIEQVVAESRLVANAKIGGSEPLHCSSVGKCLLAFASAEIRKQMLARISFDIYTENTIRDIEHLNEELIKVQKAGYAIDDRELSSDIKCVALPIFGEYGKCEYALGVSGAASRMTEEKISMIIPLLKQATGKFPKNVL